MTPEPNKTPMNRELYVILRLQEERDSAPTERSRKLIQRLIDRKRENLLNLFHIVESDTHKKNLNHKNYEED